MRLCALFLVTLTLLGCNACDREPCESFSKPASTSIPQGIAGTVSLENDAIVNGCQLCAFSAASLELWPSPVAVRAAAAGCPLAAMTGPRKVDAGGRYAEALEPGEYLLCVSSPQKTHACIGITVAPGKVTTVNVKHLDGPSTVAVLDPGSTVFRSDVFECATSGS